MLGVEERCEEIAKSLDALEYNLGSQIRGVNVASIQFFPAEWRGYRRVRSAGTQGVGGCCVATDAVLCIVNRNTTSLMRRTISDGNQIWIGGSELLSYRFDPGAYAIEGMPGCSRYVNMKTASTAGLRISPY